MKPTLNHQVGLWLGLNLLDLVLSLICLIWGRGQEIFLLKLLLVHKPYTVHYYVPSFISYSLFKIGLAFLVPLFLVRIKKLHLIRWLNIGLAIVCVYSIAILFKTVIG